MSDLMAAFVIGFLGSLHCIGMCGGISGALTAAIDQGARHRKSVLLGYQLLYSIGRIFSYACAGFIIGLAGATAYHQWAMEGPSWLRIFAGVMMILLGLYLSGWWRILSRLEQLGTHLWKRISPLSKRLIPVDHPCKAIALGMLWGWLPCGLVYSALAWSLGSGSGVSGAVLMISFGLGTLPALVSLGTFSQLLQNLARATHTRSIAGLFLIAFGLWTIGSQFFSHGEAHHHPATRSTEALN